METEASFEQFDQNREGQESIKHREQDPSMSNDQEIEGRRQRIAEILSLRLEQSSASRLAEYLTGLRPDDPRLVERLTQDHEIIRAKYHLPARAMRFETPSEYESFLKELADRLGVEIKNKSACGEFFKKHPLAGGVHLGKEQIIGMNIDRTEFKRYLESLLSLEHELIHAMQAIRSPSMPIEIAEYEAYVAGAGSNMLEDPKAIETVIFGFYMSYSVSHWYRAVGKKRGQERPVWDDPEYFLRTVDKLSEAEIIQCKKTELYEQWLAKQQELEARRKRWNNE